MSTPKPTKKFRQACEVYRIFAKPWEHLFGFTEQDLQEMFMHETHGHAVSDRNGFSHGKKWLNVTVESWREDIKHGLLFVEELRADPMFPAWWMNKVFPRA